MHRSYIAGERFAKQERQVSAASHTWHDIRSTCPLTNTQFR